MGEINTLPIQTEEAANINSVDGINAMRNQRSRLGNQQEFFTGFGNSITEQVNGFIKWFCYDSEGKIAFVSNAGVGGNTTQNMLDRLGDVPANTTLVSLMEGTNDASQSVAPLQHAINFKALMYEMINRGMRPIVVLAPPKDNTAHTLALSEMNAYDWKTCLDLGVECYNVFDAFSDAYGFYLPGASLDGTHPTTLTAKTSGKDLYAKYSSLAYTLPLNRNNNFGLIANPLMMLDGNADNKPDSWNVIGAADSLTETALGLGNTFTASATNTLSAIYQTNIAVEVGKTYMATVRLSTAVTGDGQVECYIQVGGGSRIFLLDDGIEDMTDATISRVFTSTEASSDYRFYVSGNSTAGTTSFSVAQFTLICLDDVTVPSGAQYTVSGETRFLP